MTNVCVSEESTRSLFVVFFAFYRSMVVKELILWVLIFEKKKKIVELLEMHLDEKNICKLVNDLLHKNQK